MGKLTAFVASPLRALMDLVAMRKERWTGIDWLTRGLRIEEDLLLSLKHSDFAKLRPVYKHKTANAFLDRSEEHTSELQSLMRISYAVFCLKKKTHNTPEQLTGNHLQLQQYRVTPLLCLMTISIH